MKYERVGKKYANNKVCSMIIRRKRLLILKKKSLISSSSFIFSYRLICDCIIKSFDSLMRIQYDSGVLTVQLQVSRWEYLLQREKSYRQRDILWSAILRWLYPLIRIMTVFYECSQKPSNLIFRPIINVFYESSGRNRCSFFSPFLLALSSRKTNENDVISF